MTRTADFWDKWSDKYAAQPISKVEAYEETLRRTRGRLSPDMSVLEVGCGTGSTALRLADAVTGYQGSDLSPAMIAIAKGKAAEAGVPNLRFEVSAVHNAG